MTEANTRHRIASLAVCFIGLALAMPVSASATTRNVTCSGDITSALNAAINASSNGDIVNITSGSCSMSKLSMITDKNITIQGAGKGVTVITANAGFGAIQTTGSNSPNWRLTGFTLTSTSAPGAIIVVWANQSASWRGAFRIDHINLHYPNNSPDGAIALYGPIYGVIDHCDFTQYQEAAILTGPELSTETGSITSLKGAYVASLA